MVQLSVGHAATIASKLILYFLLKNYAIDKQALKQNKKSRDGLPDGHTYS